MILHNKILCDTIASTLNFMAKVCEITNRGSLVGGAYSNRTRATQYNPTGKVRRYVNLKKKRLFIPEINKTMIVTLSTRAIKTINKKGAYAVLKEAGVI